MTYLPGSSRVSQQIWSWCQPGGCRHMSKSVWIPGWAQVSLAHGSPDPNKQRGQYSQRYNVLLPKECFSKRFFSKESNVKILFSNPGIFVKNVENPPRNFVGEKDLRNSVVTVATPTSTPRVYWSLSGQVSPFPSIRSPLSYRSSSRTSFGVECILLFFFLPFCHLLVEGFQCRVPSGMMRDTWTDPR